MVDQQLLTHIQGCLPGAAAVEPTRSSVEESFKCTDPCLARENLDRIESLEIDGGFRKRITVEARIGELKVTADTYLKK
jgi:hypothetical protein